MTEPNLFESEKEEEIVFDKQYYEETVFEKIAKQNLILEI